jgi:2'-hydroxyisoflavone reductase
MANRRDFLKASVAAGGALALGPGARTLVGQTPAAPVSRAPRALNMLILGGTSFIGPNLIHYALGRGHTIATFTRGRTEPTIYRDMYRDVEALIGDRAENHDALRGRTWDVVIDTSGWQFEWAQNSIQAVRDSTDLYLYTSSIGVYLPYRKAGLREEDEVLSEDPPSVPANQRPTYGVMKVQSEAEVRRAFGNDRSIIVRPGYIAGPAETTNRYVYWPLRLERGGEVLVPGKPDDPVQYTDVRDLAEFMIHCAENRTSGTYNVVGPASPLTMPAFVHGVHAVVSSEVEWVMIDDHDFLTEQRVRFVIPWIMPVDEQYGALRINIDRAKAAGLTHRPVATTASDALEWWHSDAVTDERRQQAWAGQRGGFPLPPDREQEILRAWRNR